MILHFCHTAHTQIMWPLTILMSCWPFDPIQPADLHFQCLTHSSHCAPPSEDVLSNSSVLATHSCPPLVTQDSTKAKTYVNFTMINCSEHPEDETRPWSGPKCGSSSLGGCSGAFLTVKPWPFPPHWHWRGQEWLLFIFRLPSSARNRQDLYCVVIRWF